MKKERKSNIELLRIVSMIFIISSHFCSHGNFVIERLSVNGVFLQFIQILGKIGVSMFVLISGYFLIENKKISIKKLLLLWIQIVFYSILIYFIVEIIINGNFNIKQFIKLFLPISMKPYWFISAYFIIYLFHPFINKMLLNLDKEKYKVLIIMMTSIWCVIPTLLNKSLECNNFLWLVYLYIIAGYIKLYYNNNSSKKKEGIAVILSFLLCIMIIIICDFFNKDYKILFGLQKIPTLITSVSIFLLFLKISINKNIIINSIAKCTFGVYLIHDNPYLKEFLWVKFLKINTYYYLNPFLFILYTLSTVLCVFIACTIIEYIRKLFESKLLEGKILNEIKIANKEIEI